MTTCIMKEMCNNGKVELVCKPNELQTLDQRGRGEVNPNNHAIYYKPPPILVHMVLNSTTIPPIPLLH